MPAISVFSGIVASATSASVRSDALVGSSPAELVRPPAEGGVTMINPFVGIALELSTPALRADYGRPRVFIHGDVVPHFGFEQDIAREGAPDVMVDPFRPLWPEAGIPGQGSTTSAKLDSPVLAAGVGVAFSFRWVDRRWRIKPSIEFIHERYEIRGRVNRADRLSVGSNGPPPIPATFRFIEIRGSTVESFNSIGGGIELEVDVARTGPVLLSLGVSGRFYGTLGDRRSSFAGSYSDGIGTETATFTFEKGPWTTQVGAGLRFRWAPE